MTAKARDKQDRTVRRSPWPACQGAEASCAASGKPCIKAAGPGPGVEGLGGEMAM